MFIVATPSSRPEVRKALARYIEKSTIDVIVEALVCVGFLIAGFALLLADTGSVPVAIVSLLLLIVGLAFLGITLVNRADNHRVHRAVKDGQAIQLPLAVLYYLNYLLSMRGRDDHQQEFLAWVSAETGRFLQFRQRAEEWKQEITTIPPEATRNLDFRLALLVDDFVGQLPDSKGTNPK